MKEIKNTEIVGLVAAFRGMDTNSKNELRLRLEKVGLCPRCKRVSESPRDDKSPFYCRYCGQKNYIGASLNKNKEETKTFERNEDLSRGYPKYVL